MGDVGNPIGEPGEALRDAWAGTGGLSRRDELAIGGLRGVNRLVAVALADMGALAAATGQGEDEKSGNEEGQDETRLDHRSSIAGRGFVDSSGCRAKTRHIVRAAS